MEALPGNELFVNWLVQYGSIALFVLLTFGIVILPVPEETLMVFAGVLMHKGHLNIPFTIIAAYAGSVCGISMSYILGRSAGNYLLHKCGWAGITEAKLERAHRWFERFGTWTLLIGYFIPGIRHFTGLSAGATKLHFKKFAIFAYVGAAIWVSTFLCLGYFLVVIGCLYMKSWSSISR